MNKMILKVGATVVASMLFVGCGSSTSNVSKTKQITTKKVVSNSGKPMWVSTPNMDGYTGVVSIVSKKKIKNKKKLYYVAKLKARAGFESRKGTKVDSTSSTRTTMDGKMSYSEKVKIKSNSIQTAQLIVKDTFEDKDNFYMWMVVKK